MTEPVSCSTRPEGAVSACFARSMISNLGLSLPLQNITRNPPTNLFAGIPAFEDSDSGLVERRTTEVECIQEGVSEERTTPPSTRRPSSVTSRRSSGAPSELLSFFFHQGSSQRTDHSTDSLVVVRQIWWHLVATLSHVRSFLYCSPRIAPIRLATSLGFDFFPNNQGTREEVPGQLCQQDQRKSLP